MALPTVVKTWQFNVNNAIVAQGSALADNRSVLLAVKNAMIGFGTNPWTVVSSSNSVTANSSDNWTTTANLIWAAAGANHSWIVLKQTGIGTNFQLLLSCSPASPNGVLFNMKISPATGFTGGTISADPTAADSMVLLSGTAWSGLNADQQTRWSVMQSTDGQCTRMFFFSAGVIMGNWFLEKFANPTGGTPGASNSGWGCVLNSLIGNTLQNGVTTGTNVSYESASNIAIASEISGVWDIFPVALVGTTVGGRGRLGTLQDLWLGSLGVATGDTYPATGSPAAQFVQISGVNGVIYPWNNGAFNLT